MRMKLGEAFAILLTGFIFCHVKGKKDGKIV